MMESKKNQDKEVHFKTLTPGLGFHPFSNGLPYASPQSIPQKKQKSGAGAEAAGPPRFVKPSQQPVVRWESVPTPVKAEPPKESPQPKSLSLEKEFGFIYSCKRVLAYSLDLILNLLCTSTLFFFVFSRSQIDSFIFTEDFLVLGGIIFFLAHWCSLTLQEMIFKTSMGKKIFHLSLPGGAGTILVRALAFPVSVFLLGLGIFWALFDSKSRCWHDSASKLQPIETARL